jgi:hypothetical protein
MFYSAYIHTDAMAARAAFSRMCRGVLMLVEINMQQFYGRAERINITLPRRLLVKIDAFISEHPQFSNRSAFLAEAARRVLPGRWSGFTPHPPISSSRPRRGWPS